MPCARSARTLLIEGLTSLAFKIVEDIAATLRVRREDLNIVASPKGLFAGYVQIITKDGKVVEAGQNVRIRSVLQSSRLTRRAGRSDPTLGRDRASRVRQRKVVPHRREGGASLVFICIQRLILII